MELFPVKKYPKQFTRFLCRSFGCQEKVLLLAYAPHPDLAAIKSAMEELKNYEVEIQYASVPPVLSELTQMVILHNLPNINAELTPFFSKMDAMRIPRVYIIGNQTDINMLQKRQDLVQVNGYNGSSNEAQAIVSETFNLFTLTENTKK